mgnify:FL=1
MKISGSRINSFLQKPNPDILGVLLFGPELGLIKERSKILSQTIVKNLNDPFRVSSISISELKANPSLLNDQAAQLTLSEGKRVIIISEATDSISNIFKDFINISNSQALVIVESGILTPRSTLRKLFEKSQYGAAIGCYEDDTNTLRSVILETLKRFNLTITDDAIAYLMNKLGSNRLLTRGEIEKLAIYIGNQSNENKEVSLNDAVACIGDSSAISLDLVVYAATDGNLQVLDNLIKKAFENGSTPVGIIRAVQQQLQKLHLVISILETGLPFDKALAMIRPPIIFKHKKQFQSQIHKWNKDNIIKALDLLIEAEINCKSTGFPANSGCHRALMRVAQTACMQK